MAVHYGSPDFFPQTWALFACPCGRLECEHGRQVEQLPPGWDRIELHEAEIAICPTCSAARRGENQPAPA
jgi:hypothetical protein